MLIRKFKGELGIFFTKVAIVVAISFLFSIFFFIFIKGFDVLSISFLIKFPRGGMTRGGIFPAIVGTFLLAIGSIIVATPIGVATAIYLTEYAKNGKMVFLIRMGINNLAGTPSVVFGLFGSVFFVKILNFKVSLLSGVLTLGILILPIIIRASEEAILAVPFSFREAAYGLGISKWRTIKDIVLPNALEGILTSIILSVGRAAGETAPILYTAATFYSRHLPHSVFDEVMALPYTIYALMTEGTMPEKQVPIAYGSAFVLIFLVLGINIFAIIIRNKARKEKKW